MLPLAGSRCGRTPGQAAHGRAAHAGALHAGACRCIMHMHASSTCMHCPHARIVLMHASPTCTHRPHARIVHMHASSPCTHRPHASIVHMHASPTCMHRQHVRIILMHASSTCKHCPHVDHLQCLHVDNACMWTTKPTCMHRPHACVASPQIVEGVLEEVATGHYGLPGFTIQVVEQSTEPPQCGSTGGDADGTGAADGQGAPPAISHTVGWPARTWAQRGVHQGLGDGS